MQDTLNRTTLDHDSNAQRKNMFLFWYFFYKRSKRTTPNDGSHFVLQRNKMYAPSEDQIDNAVVIIMPL